MNLPSGESFPVSLVYTKRVIDLKGDLFVGYMLLFSVVIGLVLTLLLTPLRLIVRKKGTEQQVPLMWIADWHCCLSSGFSASTTSPI